MESLSKLFVLLPEMAKENSGLKRAEILSECIITLENFFEEQQKQHEAKKQLLDNLEPVVGQLEKMRNLVEVKMPVPSLDPKPTEEK